MEGDNAYEVAAGQRVTALKRNCISKLPHTLVIHLKRFEFDLSTLQRCVSRRVYKLIRESNPAA